MPIDRTDRTCFATFVMGKFRSSIEPHINPSSDKLRKHELKAPGTLLVAFSGDLGSTVLLHLLHRCYLSQDPRTNEISKGGKNHPRTNPLWPAVSVCYVEECNAFSEVSGISLSSPSRYMPNLLRQDPTRDRTEGIQSAVEAYNCGEFIPLRLEDAFDARWWTKLHGEQGLKRMQFNFSGY